MTDMKRSQFTDQQIIGFLRQAEAGMPVKDLCRKEGFSDDVAADIERMAKLMSTGRSRHSGRPGRHLAITATTHRDACRRRRPPPPRYPAPPRAWKKRL